MRYNVTRAHGNAEANCIEEGGRLTEVRSQHDFDKVLQRRRDVSGAGVWLGGRKESGTWVWVSNGEEINMTIFWGGAHPDDQSCLAIHRDGLADARCGTGNLYLCEFY